MEPSIRFDGGFEPHAIDLGSSPKLEHDMTQLRVEFELLGTGRVPVVEGPPTRRSGPASRPVALSALRFRLSIRGGHGPSDAPRAGAL